MLLLQAARQIGYVIYRHVFCTTVLFCSVLYTTYGIITTMAYCIYMVSRFASCYP